jgi:hypothetical protein
VSDSIPTTDDEVLDLLGDAHERARDGQFFCRASFARQSTLTHPGLPGPDVMVEESLLTRLFQRGYISAPVPGRVLHLTPAGLAAYRRRHPWRNGVDRSRPSHS